MTDDWIGSLQCGWVEEAAGRWRCASCGAEATTAPRHCGDGHMPSPDATWIEPEPPRNPWPWWLRAILYGSCAAAIGLAATGYVRAAEGYWPKRMTLEGATPECWATVRIENRLGTYNATETLETERGPVSIRYTTVGQHAPGDDDKIEVVSVPEGVAAWPWEAEIEDGAAMTICLTEDRGV